MTLEYEEICAIEGTLGRALPIPARGSRRLDGTRAKCCGRSPSGEFERNLSVRVDTVTSDTR